jgi:hypothetical protein
VRVADQLASCLLGGQRQLSSAGHQRIIDGDVELAREIGYQTPQFPALFRPAVERPSGAASAHTGHALGAFRDGTLAAVGVHVVTPTRYPEPQAPQKAAHCSDLSTIDL